MATKAEILQKFITNFLSKTPTNQITPEGLVESLTEVLEFGENTVAALQTNTQPILNRLTGEYPEEIQNFLEANNDKFMLFHLMETENEDPNYPTGVYYITSSEIEDEGGSVFTNYTFNLLSNSKIEEGISQINNSISQINNDLNNKSSEISTNTNNNIQLSSRVTVLENSSSGGIDEEFGTFQPLLVAGASGFNAYTTSQTGNYYRKGNICYWNFSVLITSPSVLNTNGGFSIIGLPFRNLFSNFSGATGVVNIQRFENIGVDFYSIMPEQVDQSTPRINLYIKNSISGGWSQLSNVDFGSNGITRINMSGIYTCQTTNPSSSIVVPVLE